MATTNNRRARRAAKKEKGVVPVVRLMPYPGNSVTAGTWLDIINTSWRNADKCSYECKGEPSWIKFLGTLKIYFAPITPKFKVVEWTAWDDNTEFLFTLQSTTLLLNITFRREEGTLTLCYRLPSCVFDFANMEDMLVKKSSSFFQLMYDSWRTSVTKYTQEQKFEVRDTYLSWGHDKDYADVMSGLFPQTDIELNIVSILTSSIVTPLLRIFKTLAFLDYSQQRNAPIMQSGDELCVSANAMADIEAVCTNHTRDFSNIPITYKDGPDGDSTVVGDYKKFYKAHGEGITPRDLAILRTNVAEKDLNLDTITDNSRKKFVVLDACGNPMIKGGMEEYDSGSWLVTDTGLHMSFANYRVYGFHKKEGNEYRFVKFAALPEILGDLEKDVQGVNRSRWAAMLDPKFELKGCGLRGSIPEEEDLPTDVTYYSCSNEFLEILPEDSNIQNLDQANFFIEGFLRMLRRKKAPNKVDYCYCTGLTGKDGGLIYFHVPNLYDELSKIKPCLLSTTRLVNATDESRVYRFFRDPKYLRLENSEIKVDENALVHMAEEREYRVPAELARESRPQLMEWIRDSLRYAKLMMEFNPYFAQPCYSERLDKVCFLLPLYSRGMHDREHLAAAMFINNGRAATIYSVDMARDHACLFPFSKAVWLP